MLEPTPPDFACVPKILSVQINSRQCPTLMSGELESQQLNNLAVAALSSRCFETVAGGVFRRAFTCLRRCHRSGPTAFPATLRPI